MQEDVVWLIRGCIICCIGKPSNRKQGLYHPLPIPTRPWDSISMDFVGGLPTTRKGHDYLFVVANRFSKMCILMPCKKTITGQVVANMFFEKLWVHFWIPSSIISERDTIFLNALLTTLWEKINTKLKRSTTFQPQTNGQIKVVNRALVRFLRDTIRIQRFGMKICLIFSTLIIECSILLLVSPLWKLALGICHLFLSMF